MSSSNGSTAEAIDLGALIMGAKTERVKSGDDQREAEAAEAARQAEADQHEAHLSEVASLEQQVADLTEQLEAERRVPKFVFEDPKYYEWFQLYVKSEYFLDNCINGDGSPVPIDVLDELNKEMAKFRTHVCANGAMPTSPPTAPVDPEDPPAKKRGLKYLGPLLRGAPVSQPTTQKGR